MEIKITADHIEYLRSQRIFLHLSGDFEGRWLKVGASYNTTGKALIEPYSVCTKGPRLSSVGAFSYTKSYFPPQIVSIGRYCAIAENSSLMQGDHPQGRLSMCGFDYSRTAPFGDFEKDKGFISPKKGPAPTKEAVTIGHDVWIGQEVLIKRGVTIGHGAVIGARALVNKDVPPYAVVGGLPAKFIKWRFPEPLIERLLASRWWDYSYDQFAGMDTTDPLEFLPAFEYAKAAGKLTPHPETRIDVHAAFREISQKAAA